MDTHHTVWKVYERDGGFKQGTDPADIWIYQIDRIVTLLGTRRQYQAKNNYYEIFEFHPDKCFSESSSVNNYCF